jgi:L-seryl-tRNA(Ser) seleniumtransferase
MHALPGYALSVQTPAMNAEALARRLRTGPVSVVGRIERDRVLLDLRTVTDGELEALSAALRRALTPG